MAKKPKRELEPGPEIAEEYWEGDDDADVIEVAEDESVEAPAEDESVEAPEVDDDTLAVESESSVSADASPEGAHADADIEDAFVSADVPIEDAHADSDLDDELADVIDSEIHELAAERDQFKDIAQRLQADFENYRKRVSGQVDAEVERATGRLAGALLPVLDAAEAAYIQHPDEIGPLLNLMLAELRKHGLEHIDLLDKPFDPNLAEAVAHEPGDGGEPVVAEVLRSGYLWHGRTLRPAMVRTRD